MRILVKNNKTHQWDYVNSTKPKHEIELQHLLEESPSIIPIDEIREDISPLLVSIREFGLPGSGNTDVLAFSADGDIAIIECKLASNSESKRKVIGQILEYAAYLWEMSYDELNSRVQRIRNKSLIDLMTDSVAAEWDSETFRSRIEESLINGVFMLIIVVDEINDELKRIINYVNGRSGSDFSLHALELNRFTSEGIEVLVPHLHGIPIHIGETTSKRRRWTEEEFFSLAEKKNDKDVYENIENLYKWSQSNADRVWFGNGVETGSFTFHLLKNEKTISIFSINTNGKLILNYGYLQPVLNDKVMKEFHLKITSISSFKRIPEDFQRWPSIQISEAFKIYDDLNKFKDAIIWLKSVSS